MPATDHTINAALLGAIAAVLLLLLLVISRRKRMSNVRVETLAHSGYAIPVTVEMLEAERQDNDEVMRLLEATIRSSGLFRIKKIPELVSKLRGGSSPFARLSTHIAFEGDQVLSVEEKRALGLNTRLKYSKSFIEYFDPRRIHTIEPKSVLGDMHLSAFHRVARKRDLIKFGDEGFVKKVRIVPVGDARDCNKIKRFKKIHNLSEVPELPLPGCTAPYCRCMYEPIIST
jgi:hypothetical protein